MVTLSTDPSDFPFRAHFTSAQLRAARKNSSWMKLVCGAIAEQSGIALVPAVTPGQWYGKIPGAAELCAKIHSVRTVRRVRMEPFHQIKIELAAFNSKGKRIAWNEDLYLLTFRNPEKRGALTLDASSKRALLEVAKKGRPATKSEPKTPPKTAATKKAATKKAATKKAATKKAKPIVPLRPTFEATFAELAQRGAHFEHLRYGKPASASSLDKIERKVLGGPMDPHLRAFFEEMDGIQCCYWIDPLAKTIARDAPKPRLKRRLSWEESLDSGSKLWLRIDELVNAWKDAGSPKRDDGETFVLGVINIPDHKTMFTTDWDAMLCFESGEYLFDAHHHYRGEYLEYSFDPETGRQKSFVVSATDSFAARYDGGSTKVGTYLHSLAKRGGVIDW